MSQPSSSWHDERLQVLEELQTTQAHAKQLQGLLNGIEAKIKSPISMPKGQLARALASDCEVKKSVATHMLDTLVSIATAELKKTGQFRLPGVLKLKIHTKSAKEAGGNDTGDKVVMVKASHDGHGAAKPAKKILKAFPDAAIKALPDYAFLPDLWGELTDAFFP